MRRQYVQRARQRSPFPGDVTQKSLFPSLNGDSGPSRGGSEQKDATNPPGSPNLSALSGDHLRALSRPHESEPLHTFRLARELRKRGPKWERGEDAIHQPFPENVRRVPVPDVVLSSLSSLSGCAVRAACLLIRKAYRKDAAEWETSPRYWTARDLAGAYGLGMCRESLRRAMKELAGRGWVTISKGGAESYRWALSAPQERFTPIPLPVLRAHPRMSHSGLTLLLAIYRCTWGWTRQEDGATVHRRHERLSRDELRSLTGLCGPTVRSAAEELRRLKAIVRDRPHRGTAWWWRPSRSFLREYTQKSYGGTSRDRVSKPHTHGRGNPRNGPVGHTKGGVRRKTSQPQGRGDLSEEWQRSFFDAYTAGSIGMAEGVALHYLHTRAERVHTSTLRALRQRRSQIDNPARWLHSALENLWFTSIPNKQPDVRKSSGTKPLAQAFAALTEENQGWEWDEDPPKKFGEEGESTVTASVEQRIGITHSEVTDAVEALHQPPGDWEAIGEDPVLFVPTKRLARWAWHHQESLKEERARRAAKRLVQIRKDFEGIDQ